MGNHGGMLTGCTQLLFLSQLPFKNEIHVLSYTIFHLRVISYPTWFFGLRPRPFSLLTQVFQLVCENGNCTDLGSQILQEDFSCSLFINQDSQLTEWGYIAHCKSCLPHHPFEGGCGIIERNWKQQFLLAIWTLNSIKVQFFQFCFH